MDDSPQWLTEREQRAWRGYVRFQAELHARLNRQLQRDSGISEADFAVLVVLSEAEGHRQRLFELGAALQWEKSRLSHHLTRMEGRDLVSRQECPSDARGSFVVLTEEGLDAIQRAAPLHVAEVRRLMIGALTEEQIEVLGDIAETVLQRIAEVGDTVYCGN